MNTVIGKRISAILASTVLILAFAFAFAAQPAAYADDAQTTSTDLMAASTDLTTQASAPTVSYRVHVQNDGWQGYRENGQMAGTEGRSLRLEGINIKLSGVSGGIAYTTHVQDVGWQGEVADGQMAGTEGRSLRLEGIKIRLTGEVAESYDVMYRVHVQNIGWMDWVRNGEMAGTEGRSLRLEGIEIKLVAKNSTPSLSYSTHVQDIGWMSSVASPATAGTEGRSLRVEALKMNLDNGSYTGGIQYRTHVQNVGWQSYVESGAVAGTTGQSLRVEAVDIKLTGEMADAYDIYYRAHVQNFGWLDWASNGVDAGSIGFGLRVEAIQVMLVPKGGAAPGATEKPTVNLLKTTLNGIDIASHQAGIVIGDVDADFVIVKATGGTGYVNPYMNTFAQATLNSNKKLGLYHFAWETNWTNRNPVSEADWFVDHVGNYIGQAALFLDWENDALSYGSVTWAHIWLDRVRERTGVTPLIYMSQSVAAGYDWSSVAPTYALWGAEYKDYSITGYQTDPYHNGRGWGAWGSPTIRQYTSTGRVSGYGGNLDLDLFYGSADAWNNLVAVG